MSSDKIYCLLKPWCVDWALQCPRPRTIARLISDASDKMRCVPETFSGRKRKKRCSAPRERIEKGFKAQFPGHCVAMDTIVYLINGKRYYVFTAIDHHSRFALAVGSHRARSRDAAAFAQLVETLFPCPITKVLTDNGSEFDKDFAEYWQDRDITHCHTDPRCPKMNAHDERFNCTIQEEFVDYHEDLLVEALKQFNDVLFEYLGRYNFRRPHYSLGYQTPAQRLASSSPNLSNMSWHRTREQQ